LFIKEIFVDLTKRWRNEHLAPHWQVDNSWTSFEMLIRHLEERTDFLPHFKQAWKVIKKEFFDDKIRIADIGSGVGWTSAIMAQDEHVERVYSIEPSKSRRERMPFVLGHFKVPENKVEIIDGKFKRLGMSSKVHLAVMNSSFHHCLNSDLDFLARELHRILLPLEAGGGFLLISGEHYVDILWTLKRAANWARRRILKWERPYYGIRRWRKPDPIDGEHWRTREEIQAIWERMGFRGQPIAHGGDLCKDKPTLFHKMGWHYYFAVLKRF
jgi:SAM-dependent methyltransferase